MYVLLIKIRARSYWVGYWVSLHDSDTCLKNLKLLFGKDTIEQNIR